jgi:hypothetical protein
MWKWRIASFPGGRWTKFPDYLLEISELHGNGHFQISKAISMEINLARPLEQASASLAS